MTEPIARYTWYFNGDAPDVVAEPNGEWVKASDLAAYFTQEDLDMLHVVIREEVGDVGAHYLNIIAAKIQALLPEVR